MTGKERIYAALAGKPVDRAPVTPIFMAWAAHYIKRTYRDYYLDGDVLVESQSAVTELFGVDQISTISDPWREASAYGMVLNYPEEGVGIPQGHVIDGPDDLAKLKAVDLTQAERTRQRIESVQAMSQQYGDTHSVLGWLEGPMAEYSDLRGLEKAMMDFVDQPDLFMEAGNILVDQAIAFARAQIDAGADMIGVGDAAASMIGDALYSEYVLPLEKRLFDAIHDAGATVKLHICGNIQAIVASMAQTGADVLDLDWMVPIDETRELVGPDVTLCGNFDPVGVLLQGTPEQVADKSRECIQQGGACFILQPGCEVPQGTPEENIRAFCPDSSS